jgi:hypothetical protein
MKLYCFDPQKKKNVLAGEIMTDVFGASYFYKKVKPQHYMIKEKSYGIQEEIIQKLLELKINEIIIETKTGQQISYIGYWLKKPAKNYGHGLQRFLGGI